MDFIDLKPAGIEVLVHWRAFDSGGEEIAQQAVGADGQVREDRRPWTIRIPLGATLGGPRATPEILGSYLYAEIVRSTEELRLLLAERLKARLPRESENGRREATPERETAAVGGE